MPLHGFLDGENKETVNLRHSTTSWLLVKLGSLENFSFNPKNEIRIINKVIVLIVTNLNVVQLKNKP